jgi:hypothetical protein
MKQASRSFSVTLLEASILMRCVRTNSVMMDQKTDVFLPPEVNSGMYRPPSLLAASGFSMRNLSAKAESENAYL